MTESSALRSWVVSSVCLVTPVVAVSSGARTLLHEASIITTKERAEMKMIEFFIARKLSLTALDIQSQSAVRRKACRNRRCVTFKSQSVADQMRFWRDPVKRVGRLRQRLGSIVKGKRISCPPRYGPPNNHDDPSHHDHVHGFPLIRSLRASTQ